MITCRASGLRTTAGPGGQLLIRLRSIAGGAIPQQTPPALGRDRPGHTSVGQPINREPMRIDLVLQPLRSEQERPTHPRACQIDYHTLTPAGGSEPAGEVHALADLEAVGGQGGAGVVAQLGPGTVEVASNLGADQVDRTQLAGAGGHELVSEKHALLDFQAVGVEGGAGVVAQPRPVTFEAAADVSA